MRTTVVCTMLLCAVLSVAVAQNFGGVFVGEPERPGFADCALEGAGACGLGLVVGAPAAYATLTAISLSAEFGVGGSGAALAGLGAATTVVYALGSAGGATLAGRTRGWSGSFGYSFGLAMVPAAAMVGCFAVGYLLDSEPVAYAGMAVFALGTPVMAAVGYNLRVRRRHRERSFGDRLDLPALSVRQAPGGEHTVAVDVRVITVAF